MNTEIVVRYLQRSTGTRNTGKILSYLMTGNGVYAVVLVTHEDDRAIQPKLEAHHINDLHVVEVKEAS